MKTFKFDTPPPVPGIYMIRHIPTGMIYFGQSNDLARRYAEWRPSIVSGINVRSHIWKRLLDGTAPADWEFCVIIEMPGAMKEELIERENQAVQRAIERCPDKVINTHRPLKPRTKQVASPSKTRIVRNGREITRPEAAEELGCRPGTLKKRLAHWRKKGVFEVDLEELKALSQKYSGSKTPL